MKFKKLASLATFLLMPGLFVPGVAEAHPGFHPDGFAAGLLHPFTGLDHLLAMTAVGFWAANLGGKARFIVPAAFVGLMIGGAILSMGGVVLPGVEQGIAASVVVLGLLIACQVQVPTVAAALFVGIFALFHGHAHGTELPEAADASSFVIGFILATFALHGFGLGLGLLAPVARHDRLSRIAGAAIASCGVALVFLAS
jgi:urease accessory protein